MGNIVWWIAAAVVFGIVAGGLYTWMSPRRSSRWVVVWLRSGLVYTLIALALVLILIMVQG